MGNLETAEDVNSIAAGARHKARGITQSLSPVTVWGTKAVRLTGARERAWDGAGICRYGLELEVGPVYRDGFDFRFGPVDGQEAEIRILILRDEGAGGLDAET